MRVTSRSHLVSPGWSTSTSANGPRASIFLGAKGGRMDRYAPDRTVKRLARRAGTTSASAPAPLEMTLTAWQAFRTAKINGRRREMTSEVEEFLAATLIGTLASGRPVRP